MSEWQEYTIEQIASVQNGYAFKSDEYVSKIEGTLEVLKMGHIERGGGLRKSPKKDFVPRTENLKKWILDKNDIVMAMTDMKDNVVILGVPALIDKSNHYVLNQRVARIVAKDRNLIDSNFLFNYLKWEEFLFTLQSKASSGVQVNLSTETIKKSVLLIPKIEEQKAIASVLSSLDDKIDLLHRQNTTLERMAETLFRQWFVEEAQDNYIGQFIDLQNGYAFKSQDFKDIGEQRVLKIKNISGGIIDVNNTDFINSSTANKTDAKFKITTGDILFAMTGAEIGKLGIVPKTNTPLWLNQRVGLLKEKFKGARFLAYLQLSSEIGQDYIENSATGSAQPNISGGLIEQCPFPKVEASRIKECAEILDVYYQKLISNLGQIQTLEKLRDNLLPKLMSGEVKVVNV